MTILLLLPLLFGPFGLLASWLPTLYLLLWPLLIQTVNRDTLVTHGLVLIIFILTCDITRQTMHKLIGVDLFSFPMGLLLLLALVTDTGTIILSLLKPLFSGLITISEPVFLALEIYLAVDLVRRFNRWISECANERDENSQELSSWEPPLSSGAIMTRFCVIVITIASYFAVYLIWQETKLLIGVSDNIPINFDLAIAALVTFQVIAFITTIYKEEGILSESALICLLSAIPILIAGWSFNHLMRSTNEISSSWTSYFPLSLFSFSSSSDKQSQSWWQSSSSDDDDYYKYKVNELVSGSPASPATRGDQHVESLFSMSGGGGGQGYIDFSTLQTSFERLTDATGLASDGITKGILLAFLRRLIMIINSILALSLKNLAASSYLSADLCYILLARVVALLWLSLVISLRGSNSNSNNKEEQLRTNNDNYGFVRHLSARAQRGSGDAAAMNESAGFFSKVGGLFAHLPVTRWTLIKVLLVLVYTQLLIQQMDNRHHLKEQIKLVVSSTGSDSKSFDGVGEQRSSQIFSLSSSSSLDQEKAAATDYDKGGEEKNYNSPASELQQWFKCMWDGAKACSTGGGEAGGHHQLWVDSKAGGCGQQATKAERLIQFLKEFAARIMATFMGIIWWFYERLARFDLFFHSLYWNWFARWRSPIIQRLAQSIFVHLYYISALLLVYE